MKGAVTRHDTQAVTCARWWLKWGYIMALHMLRLVLAIVMIMVD